MVQDTASILKALELPDMLANEPWMAEHKDPRVLAQTKALHWQIHVIYTNSLDSTKAWTCSGELPKEHSNFPFSKLAQLFNAASFYMGFQSAKLKVN